MAMKTHKATAKRVRITSTGKVTKRKALQFPRIWERDPQQAHGYQNAKNLGKDHQIITSLQ
jgi:ribosomal protein L35